MIIDSVSWTEISCFSRESFKPVCPTLNLLKLRLEMVFTDFFSHIYFYVCLLDV